MQVPFVDLHRQITSIEESIHNNINNVIREGSFINGPAVGQFERSFAAYLGVQHCIGCGNGTDALEIALEVLGIGKNDEVLVPAHTWLSSSSAINSVGATPVFVNCNDRSYTIDPEELKSKITTKTKAIIGVHLYGNPFDLRVIEIARSEGLFMIEDCAQAHGATINGQKVGSFGDIATFSFYPSKNLGCFGDGGCLVTNNDQFATKARAIHNCGQLTKNVHEVFGRNSRLDSVQAAVLSAKLILLDQWNNQRIQAAKWYNQQLKNTPVILPVKKEGDQHVYHIFGIRCPNKPALKTFLSNAGIQTGEHYPNLLPELPIYNDKGDFTPSHYIKELLSLPMFPGITEEEVTYVAEKIKDFYKE